MRLWQIIAIHVETTGDSLLPGRPQIASLCHCGEHTIPESYRRLESAGWIKFLTADGIVKPLDEINEPGRNRRVMIVLPKLTIGAQEHVVELQEPVGDLPSAEVDIIYNTPQTLLPDKSVVPHSSDYRFPEPLHTIASRIFLRDLEGREFPLPSDAALYEYSRHATTKDLQQGLDVLRRYRDRNRAVSNVVSLWKKLFDEEGHFIMRRASYKEQSLPRGKDLPESVTQERKQAARDLAAGRTIEIGLLHDRLRTELRQRGAIDERPPHCELKHGWSLVLDEHKGTYHLEQELQQTTVNA